ncbi:hypothetical protein NPIL_479481 [Nephila pilipes]|uniref:Uncharacterized protein n=1 Tax=Nephila pilipes TaxID=299642 RepID=A0A8X6MAC0_NEPPI|nr:hypothetical protein NPIL_479481 [Nephila pilipes]
MHFLISESCRGSVTVHITSSQITNSSKSKHHYTPRLELMARVIARLFSSMKQLCKLLHEDFFDMIPSTVPTWIHLSRTEWYCCHRISEKKIT